MRQFIATHSFANTVCDDATDFHQERGTTDSAGE